MADRRAAIVFLSALLLAFTATAQESAEYGRAAGREVIATTKSAAPFSGTIDLALLSGGGANGSTPRYGISAGGALMQDRLWFFASAERQNGSRFGNISLPENATMSAVSAKVNGQLGASQDFVASFRTANQPALASNGTSIFSGIAPSSLFSMHYTGIISPNMFVTASYSQSSRGAIAVP